MHWVGDIQDQNQFFLLCSSHSPPCDHCSFVFTPRLQHLWERQQSWENKCINPVPQTNLHRGTGAECMVTLPQNTSLWAERATSLTPSVRLAVAEYSPTGKCLSQQSVVSCAVFLSSALHSHQVAWSYAISQSSLGRKTVLLTLLRTAEQWCATRTAALVSGSVCDNVHISLNFWARATGSCIHPFSDCWRN